MKNWKDSEIVAYEARQAGIAFSNMPYEQQDAAVTGIILKIAVISGCQVPSDDRYLKILESEMKKFMCENRAFSQLTFEEVLTAFRFNAVGIMWEKIKHYQNIFNLDYLGEVLTQWVRFRNKVEHKVNRELLIRNLTEPENDPPFTDDQAIQHSKDLWSTTLDFMFIQSRVYGILTKRKLIELNSDQKERILEAAARKMDSICRIDNSFIYLLDHKLTKELLAKKIAVAEYISGNEIKFNDNDL